MLSLTVKVGAEYFDETTSKFVEPPVETIMLEHSLASVSKWESLYEKPFLGEEEKTNDQTIQYIRFMTISPPNHPDLYDNLSDENLREVSAYINAAMTATWFNDSRPGTGRRPSSEAITAETVYHWMIALQIPMECQYWHFNRLITLVRLINLKNAPKKNMSRRDAAAQRKALNDQRLAQYNTRG